MGSLQQKVNKDLNTESFGCNSVVARSLYRLGRPSPCPFLMCLVVCD
jgi:hypothetical protein